MMHGGYIKRLNLGNAVKKIAFVLIILILVTLTVNGDGEKSGFWFASSLFKSQIIFPGDCHAAEKPGFPGPPVFLPPPTAGPDRNREGKVVNVKDFGAKGDGQPAGSIDPCNQTQVSALSPALTACTYGETTDQAANLQAIVNYMETHGNPGGINTLWINGELYFTGLNLAAVLTPTSYPLTFQGSSQSTARLKRVANIPGAAEALISGGSDQYSSRSYSGTNSKTTAGLTVTDTTKNFLSPINVVGMTVFNAYNTTSGAYSYHGLRLPGQPNFAQGVITSVSADGHSFTVASLSGGLLSNQWTQNDHYDIEVDSPAITFNNLTLDGNGPNEPYLDSNSGGLLAINADSGHPGRLNVVCNNIRLQNNHHRGNAADGIEVEENGSLTGTNIYGVGDGTAYPFRVMVSCVEGWAYINVNNLSCDGQHECVFGVEFDEFTGYSVTKYNNATYPYAHAPSSMILTNLNQPGSATCYLSDSPGCYDTYTFNNYICRNTGINMSAGGIGATNTVTINNSAINWAGPINCLTYGGGGVFNLNNCQLTGHSTTSRPTGQPYILLIAANTRGTTTVNATNCSFGVDASVTPAYFNNIMGLSGSGLATFNLNLKRCTMGSSLIDAIGGFQKTTISGSTFNNTGFAYNNGIGATGASVNINTHNTINSAKYLGIGFGMISGAPSSPCSITQTGVVIKAVNAYTQIQSNGNSLSGVVTVIGRKTIIGSTFSPPAYTGSGSPGRPGSSVCAFGDDVLGTGNGDLYQDDPVSPKHQYRCIASGWKDTGQSSLGGPFGCFWASQWVQVF